MTKTISLVEEGADMYETENNVTLERRIALTGLMNERLATAIDVQMQMKQAHWNVKGPNFIGLHQLFDKAYAQIEEYVDDIAERIVQLGGIAHGTVRASAAKTRIPDYPFSIADGSAHVEAVARALSGFGAEVSSMINDADELDEPGTVDLFTEISRGVDKMLWFVEAHTQATS